MTTYQIDWSMEHLDKDERVYARSIAKTLERIGVLTKLPTGNQVSCRNQIQGLVATIPGSHRLASVRGVSPPSARKFADQIMGIVNEELL